MQDKLAFIFLLFFILLLFIFPETLMRSVHEALYAPAEAA